jgi:hypothetical protein
MKKNIMKKMKEIIFSFLSHFDQTNLHIANLPVSFIHFYFRFRPHFNPFNFNLPYFLDHLVLGFNLVSLPFTILLVVGSQPLLDQG